MFNQRINKIIYKCVYSNINYNKNDIYLKNSEDILEKIDKDKKGIINHIKDVLRILKEKNNN